MRSSRGTLETLIVCFASGSHQWAVVPEEIMDPLALLNTTNMNQEMVVLVFKRVLDYFNNLPLVGRHKLVAIASSFGRYTPLGPIKPGFPW
jgi:hypothetical protein